MQLTIGQLQTLAQNAGFPASAVPTAAAIAYAESGGNTCAQGDPNIGVHLCDKPNGTSTSFGLWQIHQTVHQEYDQTRLITDPAYNASAAYAISSGGSNFTPWSTFNQDLYQPYVRPLAPEPLPAPVPVIVAPVTRPKAPVIVAGLGVLALAAAAGFAAREGRQVTRRAT